MVENDLEYLWVDLIKGISGLPIVKDILGFLSLLVFIFAILRLQRVIGVLFYLFLNNFLVMKIGSLMFHNQNEERF